MKKALLLLFIVSLIIYPANTLAEDSFFAVPVRDLRITKGTLPPPTTEPTAWNWNLAQEIRPYAVIDGGEAYVSGAEGDVWQRAKTGANLVLCVRATAGKAVSGKIYLPRADYNGMSGASFVIPADQANSDARQKFYQAQLSNYEQLINLQSPGAAWFCFRADEAEKALDKIAGPSNTRTPRPTRGSDVEETYALFTGGRAVAENLQLDRAIAATKNEQPTIDISSIHGLNAAEIDWKPLIKDLHPQADPLAEIIPADQHAILFPTFNAFMTVLDTADAQGTPVLQLVEPRSEDAGTKARYQRQLGLDLSALSKLLGPAMVDSMAITGSDPYLRVGSDVAILFQTKQPDVLRNLLQAKILLSAGKANRETGNAEGLQYTSFKSEDGTLRSYLASIDSAVIVTNSPAQLAILARVIAKKSPALTSAPEYTYFRNRYPCGDENESAMIILTDATIRRWCSPRWRVADSRRTRAAAIMSDLQARNTDALINGTSPQFDPSQLPQSLGKITFNKQRVQSSVYGSLDFMTPISELPIDHVTQSEKEAYERWRDDYQDYWRWAFDPIAAKLTVNDRQLSLDLSVIPLIAGSDYSTLINLTKGESLEPDAGDPHPDLMHWVIALNRKSEEMQSAGNFLNGAMPSFNPDPLSWLGHAAAIYADDDPFWAELLKQKPEQVENFMEQSLYRLPVGLYVQSDSPLKLTLFLTAMRALVEQSAPQMTEWQALKHADRAYVKITPSTQAAKEQKELEHLSIYYAATPKALIISFNESVIQRALDREVASTQPATTQPAAPWLGSSAAMRVQRQMVDILQHGLAEQFSQTLRNRSWSNLQILNEYKRRYPNEDPVKLHQRLWATTLTCPAGGTYVWNEQDQTMESTIFGSPTTPKEPNHLPTLLDNFSGLDAGITFQDNGLRARANLERAK
ncbi:MAG TPA: hypothetical protein VHS31_14655 [Tepidisphaeraceae bacterium]|nr:hypothetical protein [Tepidisphaeraceae bacterium]